MAAQKDWGRMRISRPIVVAAGIAAVASAVFVGVTTAPRPPLGPAAPVVFYEVLDAHQSNLVAQPLDGATKPRIVASRPATAEGEVRWEVDPTGSVALAFTLAGAGSVVEAVDIAAGRTLWRQQLDRIPYPGIWSRDGRRWASTTADQNGAQERVVVIDLPAGTTVGARAERGWWPQGFTASGDLVLSEEVQGPDGRTEGWTFRLLVWGTGAVTPADAGGAATGPRSKGQSDVSTEAGRALRTVLVDDPKIGGQVERLETIDLRSGDGTVIGPAADTNYNWRALTPDASRVLVFVHVGEIDGEHQNALWVLDWRGEGAEVWRGPSPGEQVISREGRYLGMTGWVGHSLLTVLHLGSGRTVEIPLPPRTIAGAIRAIVDPADDPLIAIAPLEPQTSAAPTPAAAPLTGAPRFIAASSEVTPEGWTGHVSILAPGEGGGVAIVEAMPPLEQPIADGYLAVHPRPGSDEVLLEVASGQGFARFWLWTPGQAPSELDLPPDLPTGANQPRWRPDGGALGFHWYRIVGDGSESGVAILDLVSRDVRVIPVADPYGDLAGWAADGRRLLLNHRLCTEGCGVRLSYVAWLDPDTGAVVPFGPEDREPGVVTHLVFPDPDRRVILLSSIELEDADDVVLRWPENLAQPSSTWLDESSDGRDLHVSTTTDDVTTLYVLRDVFARGPGTFDARPVKLGSLPEGVSPRSVSADRAWVIAADRAQTTFLVKLATGESWEIGPFAEGQISWLPEP